MSRFIDWYSDTAWHADTEGSSLAEVAVAMVLLMTVLIPTALAVVALTSSSAVGVRGEALVRARTAMEETLATPPATWRSDETEEASWSVRRTVDREDGYTSVRVDVARGGSGPLVTLVSGRTQPEP